MFRLNRNWKKGKQYKVKRFDSNLINLFTPWYALSQLKKPAAIIINKRQLIVKQLPDKSDYFIDKDLGMFEINPDKAFFLNKTAIYFYDVRNQNAIHPGILGELYKWANLQGLQNKKSRCRACKETTQQFLDKPQRADVTAEKRD